MWRSGFFTRLIAVLSVALLAAAGCESAPRTSRAGDAATPQDKTHQEQLANLSAEDAQSAEATADMPESPRRPDSGRRTGQKVIDQPVRR